MRKTETITTTLKADKLKELIEMFKDLAKIKENIRFKVQDGIFMLYGIDDQSGQVLAFKYFKKRVEDFFDHDLEDIDFVILNIKKFTKNLSFYEEYNLPMQWMFECEDGSDLSSTSRMVRSLEVKNTKLRTFLLGGEPSLIRNLAIATIFDKVDTRYRRFGFEMSVADYNQILNLIDLDSTNETLEIILNGSDIIFREKGWELQVSTTDINESILMKKKYFKNFDAENVVLVDLFDTFLVLRGVDNDMVISLEHEN